MSESRTCTCPYEGPDTCIFVCNDCVYFVEEE